MVYLLLTTIPFTRRYFFKLKKEHETIFPADENSINKHITVTISKALALALGNIFIFQLVAGNDIIYQFIGIVMSILLFNFSISHTLEKMETKLMKQFSEFLDSVHHFYNKTHMIDDAIYSARTEAPYEISLHADKIHEIITGTDINAAIEQYVETHPNRFLLLFASICAAITDNGDKSINGSSMFLNNLNSLKEEINNDLLNKDKMAFLLGGLVACCLIPVYLLKPIEWWFASSIPQVYAFFKSPAATVLQCVIIVTVLISYELEMSYKQISQTKKKEHLLINRLLSFPAVRSFLETLDDSNITKAMRINDKLKLTNDSLGTQGFRIKRIMWAIGFFILFQIITNITVVQYANNLYNDFSEAFESSIVPTEEYRAIMQKTAQEYTSLFANQENITTEEITSQLVSSVGIKENLASLMAETIMERIHQHKEIYYKWYYLLLGLVVAVLGYHVPYFILSHKAKIINMNKEDEVAQFQTLAIILMHVDGTTIDTLLDWMERFSYCFRESIQECNLTLTESQEQALINLKEAEPFTPFKHFIDNMLAIDDGGIENAFASLESERNYFKDKRKQDNEIMLNKKSASAKTVGFIPLYATIILYLLLPFGIYVVEMLSEMEGIL